MSGDGGVVFSVEASGDRVFILSGELDMASTAMIEDAIRPLEGSKGDVRFDLEALTFIDSSGVLALSKAADRFDGSLVLYRPTAAVRRVLDLVGLTEASPHITIEG